jgi:hypothetical protein
MATAFGAGLLRRGRKKKLGLTLASEKTKSGRTYRIVESKDFGFGSLPFGFRHRRARRCLRSEGAGSYRLKLQSKMRSLGCATSISRSYGFVGGTHLASLLLLFRVIAYRLRANRFGDLDAETLKVLKQTARQEGPPSAVSKNLARLDQRRFDPPPRDGSGP